MQKRTLLGAILLFGFCFLLAPGTQRAAAQGPAGAGSVAATQQDSSHSLNPIKWVKKDSKNSADASASRSDLEKKLTPTLQSHGLLPANVTATDACSSFTVLDTCLAALHATRNLGLDFNCLRAAVTGVHLSADMSGCKVADGDKAQGLHKAIHQLRPEVNAKQASKDAEQQAKDDLKSIGG